MISSFLENISGLYHKQNTSGEGLIFSWDVQVLEICSDWIDVCSDWSVVVAYWQMFLMSHLGGSK